MKNKHAVNLGRLGGLSRSLAKQQASRLNGRKGGRPKKLKITLATPNRLGYTNPVVK